MKRDKPHSLIKLGWQFTAYLVCSLLIFLLTSNTILGWILYIFFLLPFYGLVLLWLICFVWCNRTQKARVQWWIWGLVIGLQVATILASPGNCYGFKQGDRCYSNLQVLVGSASRLGPNEVAHWKLVEDAFPGLAMAYSAALVVGLSRVSIVET